MFPIATHLHTFEGEPLLTVTWRGRPAWVGRQIGVRLGYSHGGKRLPNKVLGEWGGEFIEGHDYLLLRGDDLAEFRASVSVASALVPGRGSLLLLFEPGLFLVLAKTEQEIGKRLRRFLVDEVLPSLARTGRFDPDEPPPAAPHLSIVERREDRLETQAQVRALWVDHCERRLQVATLHRMVEVLGDRIEPKLRCAIEVLAAQIATQLPLLAVLAEERAVDDITERLAA